VDLARLTPSGKTTSSKALALVAQDLEDQVLQEVGCQKFFLVLCYIPFLRCWFSPHCASSGLEFRLPYVVELVIATTFPLASKMMGHRQNKCHDFATTSVRLDFLRNRPVPSYSSSSSVL
jgi:hypothetical protein